MAIGSGYTPAWLQLVRQVSVESCTDSGGVRDVYGLYRCEPGKAEAAKAYLTDQSRWAGWGVDIRERAKT
jgi:hypothetical protein